MPGSPYNPVDHLVDKLRYWPGVVGFAYPHSSADHLADSVLLARGCRISMEVLVCTNLPWALLLAMVIR